jgi:hypothetical protein
LQASIDAQGQALARLRELQVLDFLDDAAQPILDNPLLTGNAAQLAVKRLFQPFLTGIVNIGKTQQVRSHLSVRIVAAVLAPGVHARNVELQNLLGGAGGQMPA